MFFWSWTNPQSAICGLYVATTTDLRIALRDEPPATWHRVENALTELAQKPMVKYDRENEVIWVVNRVKHANRSPKVARAMQKEVGRVPDSPLLTEFVQRYGSQLGIELG